MLIRLTGGTDAELMLSYVSISTHCTELNDQNDKVECVEFSPKSEMSVFSGIILLNRQLWASTLVCASPHCRPPHPLAFLLTFFFTRDASEWRVGVVRGDKQPITAHSVHVTLCIDDNKWEKLF